MGRTFYIKREKQTNAEHKQAFHSDKLHLYRISHTGFLNVKATLPQSTLLC